MNTKLSPDQIIKAHMAKLGKKGGAATSEAKAEAARENGKKGGRPPRSKACKRMMVTGFGGPQLAAIK